MFLFKFPPQNLNTQNNLERNFLKMCLFSRHIYIHIYMIQKIEQFLFFFSKSIYQSINEVNFYTSTIQKFFYMIKILIFFKILF
jgi:hypothetical protein